MTSRLTGSFRALHLRRFRTHRSRTLLSVGGIAVGTALVATILSVEGSLIRSVERLVDLAGQADVEVSGAGEAGVDEDVLTRVEETPGVATAVPVVRSRVSVEGEETFLFGFDQRAEALDTELADRARETLEREGQEVNGLFVTDRLARSLDVGEGDAVTVVGNGRRSETTVVGVIDHAGGSAINRGRFAVAILPVAQRLAGKPDRLDAVWALAEDGDDPRRLQDVLLGRVGDRAVVSSPRLQAEQVDEELSHFEQELFVIAGAVLVVAGFLVFNTMSMAALERRRELATLRALGGRRRLLLRGFLGEAAILGFIGALIGVGAGVALARAVVGALPTLVTSGLGVGGVGFFVPQIAVVLALVTGIGATLLAAVIPARRAVSVSPVDAMRAEGAFETMGEGERTVWAAGLGGLATVAFGALMGAGAFGDGLVIPGSMVLVTGSLVAMWGFTAPITKFAAGVASRLGRSGPLAAAAVARAPRRTWATTAGVATAISIVVAIGGITSNERAVVTKQFEALGEIEVVIQNAPFDSVSTTALMPPEWEQGLREIDGVAQVWRGQFLMTTAAEKRVVLQGVSGGHLPLMKAARPEIRSLVEDGHGLVVTKAFADALGVEEGEDFDIVTPVGTKRLPVLQVVSFVGGGMAGGMAGISVEYLESWFGRAGASWYEIDVAPGSSAAAVEERVQEFVTGAPFEVFVGTGDELYEGAVSISEQFDAVFSAMGWIAVGAAALGILNTLMLSVLERRREVGVLRAIGTARRQIRGMVLGEAMAIAAIGSVIGSALGLIIHYAGIKGAEQLIGFAIDYQFTPTPLVYALVVSVVMAGAGGFLPGRRAANVNVISAIGYE